MQGLFNLIANIVVFGVIVGLINAFLPMPGQIKGLLNLLVLIVLVIYILQFFGVIAVLIPMLQIIR